MSTHDDRAEARPGDGDLLDEERLEGLAAVYAHLRRLMTGPVSGALSRTQERALRAAREPGWERSAACASADPEEWFPEVGRSARRAVSICGGCPVRRSCLATALLLTEDGVWGGTILTERLTALRALRLGVDADAVLDQVLNRQQESLDEAGRRGPRWSGRKIPELRKRDTAA